MGSPPGRSTLNRFYLFYVGVGVGRPYRGGVFQLWSDKCFVGCGFELFSYSVDRADKTKLKVFALSLLKNFILKNLILTNLIFLLTSTFFFYSRKKSNRCASTQEMRGIE